MGSPHADTVSPSVHAVSLDNARVDYGSGAVALRGVSLSVLQGETVALIGPSGAGKTTLLRLMAGMVRPSSGAVHVLGQDAADLRPGRELTRMVGMMQQQLDLVPQLAVKHNVQAGLLGRWTLWRSLLSLMLPMEAPAMRAAIRRVGLEDHMRTRVARLSGGEQQRVALARVLVQDPRILLTDEPVSSLDPALADDLLALLRDLARESGKTLVASMHIPDMAVRHFDRLVALKSGEKVFDLPSDQVTPESLEVLYRLEREPGAGEKKTEAA